MNLRLKFILLVGAIVTISFGVTFYRTSAFQHELVLSQSVRQARMLHRQILLTRKWVSDHNGLFFLRQENVGPNPFLQEPEVVDSRGRRYVKRNPAMVTRELSGYADKAGYFSYRVTTLQPINMDNAPDDFERRSLMLFEKGSEEVVEISLMDNRHMLRYIAPLVVETSCLECHGEQGYEVGDIRGGLSVIIPIDSELKNISSNNRKLLVVGLSTILVVGLTMYLMIEYLVVRRVNLLSLAMDRFSGHEDQVDYLPGGRDEIGRLGERFADLCRRLTVSGRELEKTREQVFQGEKMAALGRLTAGIAHEINNPLGGMQNCIAAIEEDPENAEMRRRYLQLVKKGLARIGHTVRQLLNFGRQEPLKLRKVHVDGLIEECFQLLEYGLKNVEMRLDLQSGGLHLVDAEALKQVLVNLGLNAVQAMPAGGRLEVCSRTTGGQLEIQVRDTGVGIEPGALPRIFDPFYTTKEVGEGTGLGLSVSYSLVRKMHGEIEVASEPGRGTVFTVRLPLRNRDAPEEEGKDERPYPAG
jgi:signal transduction histidine kinase